MAEKFLSQAVGPAECKFAQIAVKHSSNWTQDLLYIVYLVSFSLILAQFAWNGSFGRPILPPVIIISPNNYP